MSELVIVESSFNVEKTKHIKTIYLFIHTYVNCNHPPLYYFKTRSECNYW